ncbi:hypothetical protein RU820_05950 [Acidithiobacillus ferrooxidans]|uniref:Uncharacterized protein n=1 Tax=Acidithiobacillus ferrooxidans (strain ATCC 23270 / DSM 14882 / CIP 104768 / NCIMB 8455) TaxID=243159 RepID=B7J8S8_ACIF2|nr:MULTISPECIES: hypothetical protein [Acidithiobacillus]ACK80141.1 hypothetical protein AFE_1246 [Acidithiobacillus ferrooxidans ATCC 23270]MBN6745545.1 hypothetical protein [Acidithiobacillus sp. MC2.2]MBN6748428.1 hypothetical protein [Acidithiobacillus sp. PG05]
MAVVKRNAFRAAAEHRGEVVLTFPTEDGPEGILVSGSPESIERLQCILDDYQMAQAIAADLGEWVAQSMLI